MKIAFLQETVNQSIGVMYLSAILKKKGHRCELFVDSLEDNLLDALFCFEPDIIGMGVITGGHHWALRMAQEVKSSLPGSTVILGGPHPTYFPEVVKEPAIDAACRGEAELSFPEFIDRLEKKNDYTSVAGIWVKKDGCIHINDVGQLVEDLSILPHPDHELYLKYNFYRRQTEVPFSTTRGCPYNCSFCYNHVKAELYKGKGKYLRTRGVFDIINEMCSVRKMYPDMRTVILYDDIIGIDKAWLKDFSVAYAKNVGLPWFTSMRADLIDETVVEYLARANCFCASLGVESGDEDLRERVLCKRIPNAKYLEASRLLHSAGIKVRTSNMFFLPGEDINKAIKTVDLNRQMKVDFAWAYTLQPYPGTKIYEYALKNGYISGDFDFDDIDPLGLLEPMMNISDRKKILVLHRLFHFAVHSGIMRKLIKVLLFFPPNPLFDGIYYISLIKSYSEYHQVGFLRAFWIAWNNYWSTKKKKHKKAFYKCPSKHSSGKIS